MERLYGEESCSEIGLRSGKLGVVGALLRRSSSCEGSKVLLTMYGNDGSVVTDPLNRGTD